MLSEYLAKKLKYVDCCKEVQQFEKQFWWDLESLVCAKEVEVLWTIQFPGQTVCGRDGIWHQVLHLEFTQAISIDYLPDTSESWGKVQDAVDKQQRYRDNHGPNGKCQQCPMPEQFVGDSFSFDLIKFNKISMIKARIMQKKKEEEQQQQHQEVRMRDVDVDTTTTTTITTTKTRKTRKKQRSNDD